MKRPCVSFFIFLSATLSIPCAYAQQNWSLSLEQTLAIARERNYDLKLSRSAIRFAEANVEIAGAPPNPTLTTQATNINPSSGLGGGSLLNKSIDTTIRVDQLIERGGKRELRTENARKLETATRADSINLLYQLERVVTEAYIDVMAAQERLAAAKDSAKLLDAILAAAQKRKDAGDISGTDVERIRVDALRIKNELAAAEGELVRARNAIGVLLGEADRASMLEAIDPWPGLELAEFSAQTMPEQIIDARADVRAANARLEAAKTNSKFAQSLRTRDVTVGMQYEHYPQTGASSSGGASSYGVSVQIPLFVRYYYGGEIRAAEANFDNASDSLSKIRDAATSEILRTRSALQNAAERVRRNRNELLPSAEKAANAAEFAYQNGAAGVMDVLDARRTLRITRLDALAALVDYSKSVAQWRAATATTDASLEVKVNTAK